MFFSFWNEEINLSARLVADRPITTACWTSLASHFLPFYSVLASRPSRLPPLRKHIRTTLPTPFVVPRLFRLYPPEEKKKPRPLGIVVQYGYLFVSCCERDRERESEGGSGSPWAGRKREDSKYASRGLFRRGCCVLPPTSSRRSFHIKRR